MEPCPKLEAKFLLKKKFADQILDGKKIYEGRPHSKSFRLQAGNFIGFTWCSATVKLVCEVKEILPLRSKYSKFSPKTKLIVQGLN